MTTGGGITADMCGAAIVASARVYEDDPVLAVTGRATQRRCLAPAVFALAAAAERGLGAVAGILETAGPKDLTRARAIGGARFEAAIWAAQRAAEAMRAADVQRAAAVAIPPLAGRAPAPLHAASTNDQIVNALADGAHTTCGLASRLGLKEAVVCQALSMLRHEGRVACDPDSAGGPRARYWRLADRGRA